MSNKIQNVVKNLFGAVLYQICSLVLNIVVLKLFLQTYGSEINGLISTSNQVLGYVALLEAGLGVTAIQALYKPVSEKKYKEINSILRATSDYYNKTAAIYAISVVVVAVLLPFVINTTIPFENVVILFIILALPNLLDYLFQGKMRVMLTADQDVFTLNLLNTITLIFSSIFKIHFINKNYSYLFVQSIFVIFTIIKVLILRYYYLKRYKWIDLKVEPNKKALGQKNANLIHQIAGVIVQGTDAVVISIFLGLKYASVYAVYSVVFSVLSAFMWQFSNAATPSFGHYMIQSDNTKLKKVFLDFSCMFYILVFTIYSVAFICIDPFVDLYTGNITDINYKMKYLPILFVIIGVSNCIRIPSNNLINAAGYFDKTKNRAIIEAVINITISVTCVQFMGIYGVLIGTICSFMYRTIDILLFTNKYIVNNVLNKQIKMILLDASISSVAVIGFSTFRGNTINAWYKLFFGASISASIIMAIIILSNVLCFREYMISNLNRLLYIVRLKR